jgi:hypothetical protein
MGLHSRLPSLFGGLDRCGDDPGERYLPTPTESAAISSIIVSYPAAYDLKPMVVSGAAQDATDVVAQSLV